MQNKNRIVFYLLCDFFIIPKSGLVFFLLKTAKKNPISTFLEASFCIASGLSFIRLSVPSNHYRRPTAQHRR